MLPYVVGAGAATNPGVTPGKGGFPQINTNQIMQNATYSLPNLQEIGRQGQRQRWPTSARQLPCTPRSPVPSASRQCRGCPTSTACSTCPATASDPVVRLVVRQWRRPRVHPARHHQPVSHQASHRLHHQQRRQARQRHRSTGMRSRHANSRAPTSRLCRHRSACPPAGSTGCATDDAAATRVSPCRRRSRRGRLECTLGTSATGRGKPADTGTDPLGPVHTGRYAVDSEPSANA